MDRLENPTFISIFKYLDVLSRIRASQTCKQWRGILRDSESLMDDVWEVYLEKLMPDSSEIPSIMAMFSQLKNCHQLKLGPAVARGFLSEQHLKAEMGRFGKIVLISMGGNASVAPWLPMLPSSVRRLQLENNSSAGFSLDLPDSVQLEGLDLAFGDVEAEPNAFTLPSTLTQYGYVCQSSSVRRNLLSSGLATAYFQGNLRVGPSLSEMNTGGLTFNEESFASLLRTIRDQAPNLGRISFQECGFVIRNFDPLIKEFTKGGDCRQFPFKWIKLDGPHTFWANAVKFLLQMSHVETLVVNLRFKTKYPCENLSDVYGLTPLMKEKGTKLELTINPDDRLRYLDDLEGIPVPQELSSVLTKLELITIHHHARLLEMILSDDNSFELLTEIGMKSCIGLGDSALEIVAKTCKNLKKLQFHPHSDEGPDSLTNQCLIPFMVYWHTRKSAQLSIECLKPALPFGGFNLPIDQEKGEFHDGKKWMVFRKSCLLDGCDQLGTRLAIWDPPQGDGVQKSMIITNYKRSFEKQIKISVVEGKSILKEKRGSEFEIDKSD